MLETKICLQTGSAPSVTFTLAICNVGGSSLRGDYAASLRQDDAGPVLATAKLRHYPRWSESVLGLVARALALVIAGGPPWCPRGRAVRATVFLRAHGVGRPQQLATADVTVKKGIATVDVADNHGLRIARAFLARGRMANALELLVCGIALALWDQDTIAPLPAALGDRS